MAINVITEYTNLDKFFFYFFLPILVVFAVGSNRYYFRIKEPKASIFKITKEIIFGNFVIVFMGFLVALFLYIYILELDIFKSAKWEMLTLISFIFLSFPIGLGAGAHTAAVSIRKLLDPRIKNAQEITRAIHFFHYPFSHQLLFIPTLLMFYLLALLDLFKGRTLDLHPVTIVVIVLAGIILGSLAGILFIITRCQRLILPTIMILTISLFFVSQNEARDLLNHPVALLYASQSVMVAFGLLVYKQSKINLRGLAKRLVKRYLQWDIDYL